MRNEKFGARCVFEADDRVLGDRIDEVGAHVFAQLGFRLTVVEPGRPTTLYHAETSQEAFLVLAGECVLIVEGEERPLRAWDFFHCPAGTGHAFVATGEAPCVLLGVGARGEGSIVYPVEPAALRHDAGVETETTSPAEAYAPHPPWTRGRPPGWNELPWA